MAIFQPVLNEIKEVSNFITSGIKDTAMSVFGQQVGEMAEGYVKGATLADYEKQYETIVDE